MNRTLKESLAWSAEGTELCRKAIASLEEPAYAAPTLLAGWSRRHLVAHLAANAEAIGRLVSWARTGLETRMYSSPGQREADIEVLEAASHTLDPAQQTDMATMQRMNQALLLQLRTQQEANQINQAQALQQIVAQKQQQDALKAGFQDASDFSSTYETHVAPAYNGAAQALTY